MIKFTLLLLILFAIAFYTIYRDFNGDRKKFFIDIALLAFLLLATGFSKYIRVYLPLFLIHLFLLTVAWISFYLYLFGVRRRTLLIFAPFLSIITFFILGIAMSDF